MTNDGSGDGFFVGTGGGDGYGQGNSRPAPGPILARQGWGYGPPDGAYLLLIPPLEDDDCLRHAVLSIQFWASRS